MFESLSDKLKRTLKNLRGEGVLTKEHVDAALREIRLALLEADVNYKVAKDFIVSVKEKAEGQQVWQELKPSEQVVKIVYDELVHSSGKANDFIVRELHLIDAALPVNDPKRVIVVKNDHEDDAQIAGIGGVMSVSVELL